MDADCGPLVAMTRKRPVGPPPPLKPKPKLLGAGCSGIILAKNQQKLVKRKIRNMKSRSLAGLGDKKQSGYSRKINISRSLESLLDTSKTKMVRKPPLVPPKPKLLNATNLSIPVQNTEISSVEEMEQLKMDSSYDTVASIDMNQNTDLYHVDHINLDLDQETQKFIDLQMDLDDTYEYINGDDCQVLHNDDSSNKQAPPTPIRTTSDLRILFDKAEEK